MADKSSKNKKKVRKPLIPWISKKHRLVVVNDSTFIEEKSWRLSPTNVWIWASISFFSVVIFTLLLVKFTPLGWIISPGKSIAQHSLRKEMDAVFKQLDSLNQEIAGNADYVENIKKVTSQEFEYEKDMKKEVGAVLTESGKGKTFDDVPEKSDETNTLIQTVEVERELGSLIQSIFLEGIDRIDRNSFVPPVKGIISDTFAPARSHYGTDIVAPKGTPIQAVRGGTVILSAWSADTGHMIAIQHDNNLVSWYKHNSARLKNTGDRINAGEAIAIIGNTGEMTNGPHLHFELWYNGQPVNPENYISF